jgi:hypothetical protein
VALKIAESAGQPSRPSTAGFSQGWLPTISPPNSSTPDSGPVRSRHGRDSTRLTIPPRHPVLLFRAEYAQPGGGHFENFRRVPCSNHDTLSGSGKTDSCRDQAGSRAFYRGRLSLETGRLSESKKPAFWHCFLGRRSIRAAISELDLSTRGGKGPRPNSSAGKDKSNAVHQDSKNSQDCHR